MIRPRSILALILVGALAMALAGCPLELEKEPGTNVPPNTYFEVAPADTIFSNLARFDWEGTDLDSDVVAYQYQFVEVDSVYYFTAGQAGEVIRSIDPLRERLPGEDDRRLELWGERQLDDFQSFSELEDGWYEMRARAIDDLGEVDLTPASTRFYVFFDDVPPVPVIRVGSGEGCGRLENSQSRMFCIDASDSSRNAATPRELLQYGVQLRRKSGTGCTHNADPFSSPDDARDDLPEDGWGFFPVCDPGSEDCFICVGDRAPTFYGDLGPPGCTWTFRVRVRDPAGNSTTIECDLESPGP